MYLSKLDFVRNSFLIAVVLTVVFATAVVPARGQTLQIMVDEIVSPDQLVIFYVGDFDFMDASSNPVIFNYRLSELTNQPATVMIDFEMRATVPTLGLFDEQIMHAQTSEFTFNNPISISNRDIDERTADIGYITDELGNRVDFDVPVTEQIDPDLQEDLIAAVMEAGKLPAGIYTFSFIVTSPLCPDGSCVSLNFESPKIMTIENPTTLDLVGPGGYPEDQLQIFSLYPIFQWESQGCEYFLKVCEFDPAVHGTPEVALNDLSSLPFPDDGFYFPNQEVPDLPGNLLSTTFQYPLSGAKPLEYGKTYVWAIKKKCLTTGGYEEINSDIFAFTIADVSAPEGGAGTGGGVVTDPVLAALQTIFGEALYEGLFAPGGELNGYTTVNSIVLNGETATETAVSDLAGMKLAGDLGPMNIEIQ